jgi:small subunit ribosomal protein S6
MKEYETIFVLDPGVDDAQVDTEVEKVREFITGRSGEVTEIQKWGRRKLAYEINKKKEGIYTLIRFRSGPDILSDLDRRYRLNENMLRFLTVLFEGPTAEEQAARRERSDRDDDDEDSEE